MGKRMKTFWYLCRLATLSDALHRQGCRQEMLHDQLLLTTLSKMSPIYHNLSKTSVHSRKFQESNCVLSIEQTLKLDEGWVRQASLYYWKADDAQLGEHP
jgi:hypothetical protein